MNQDSLVFADFGQTFQPEVFRVSLDTLDLQRETTNDQIQSYPILTQDELFFIDYRYSSTAQGNGILNPLITTKKVPKDCDAFFKSCPDGFICDLESYQCKSN
jgi:hypothetical protein